MNPYDIDYATKDFWDALKARLLPILGDVETTLGYTWMDQFENCFSRADFWALAAAKKSKSGFDWHLIELFDAAEEIVDDESIMAADSRAEAIAYLLYQCTEHGVWPDAVQCHADDGRIEFASGGQPFAVIRRLPPSAVSIEVCERVEGTLLGLRKAAKLNTEFTKRLRRWPGLSKIDSNDEGLKHLDFHLPDTSEWLLSAKKLATLSGLPALTTSQAQNLAAIAFGELSWNHLCGHLKHVEASRSLVSLCCPWYIYQGYDDKVDDSTVYQEFSEAFATFLGKAKEIVSTRNDPQQFIQAVSTTTGLPYFQLVCGKGETPTTKQLLSGDWDHGIKLGIQPVTPIETDDVWLARVKSATQKGDLEPVLVSLFQIKQDASQKHKFRLAEKQLELIVKDGPWIFSFESENSLNEQRLEALYTNQAGNTLFAATAKLRKAQLTWNEGLEAYVLSSEYDGKKPVAIIRSISKESAQMIRSHFHDSPMGDNFFMDSSTYQNDLTELKRDMRFAGVLGI